MWVHGGSRPRFKIDLSKLFGAKQSVRAELRDDDLYLDGRKVELKWPVNPMGACFPSYGGFCDPERCLPASVLNGLLCDPELVPQSWRRIEVYFWGTYFESIHRVHVHFNLEFDMEHTNILTLHDGRTCFAEDVSQKYWWPSGPLATIL